ncbi:MAG: shikimate kinase [Vicinamibacteria bacterium]|nr:shikimate kinase [Vicinamibacteria bacterium]
MDDRNIFLVGMMGAGKTTVGKALARRLGRQFIDCDREIVERTGVPIATIFEIEGEEGFRRRETHVLAELAARRGTVVATGGGAVLAAENRRTMRASGTVIYLRVSLDHLHERTRRDTARPLLATGDRRATLESLLEKRHPLYQEAADLVVDSGAQSPGTLAQRVIDALNRDGGSPGETDP